MKENFPLLAALTTTAILGLSMYYYNYRSASTPKEIQRIEITLKEDAVVQQSGGNRTYNFNIQVQAGTKLHIDVNNGASKVRANSVAESNVFDGVYQSAKQLVSDFFGWLDDYGSIIFDIIIHWLLG